MDNDKKGSDQVQMLKEQFLVALRDPKVGGNVTVALEKSGVARSSAYLWKNNDPEFSKQWDEIVIEAKHVFADEAEYALRRGVLGGNMTAVIFSLKNLRPKDWSDRVKIDREGLNDAGTYEEYVKRCEQLGVDPITGLRVSRGEGEMEQD